MEPHVSVHTEIAPKRCKKTHCDLWLAPSTQSNIMVEAWNVCHVRFIIRIAEDAWQLVVENWWTVEEKGRMGCVFANTYAILKCTEEACTYVQTLSVWCLLWDVTMVTVAQEVKEQCTGWKTSTGDDDFNKTSKLEMNIRRRKKNNFCHTHFPKHTNTPQL